MPLLERTPPSKAATPLSSQPAVASSPSRFTRARTSLTTAASAAFGANEFPSLEDMALPHIQHRHAAAAAAVRPTPLRTKPAPRAVPGSASRAAGTSRGVPTSLPRPTSDRAGTLYPSVGAAAKRAGNLTSRASLTGLEAARAHHVQGTPHGVAKAREAARNARQTSQSEEDDVRAALGVELDVEAGKLPSVHKGVGDVTHTSVQDAPAPAAAPAASTSAPVAPSPLRTPARNSRASAALRQSPRRSARKDTAAAAEEAQSMSEVEAEFERRLQAMGAGNPFADSKRADMRKSCAVPAASTSAPPPPAAPAPQSAFERQVELAMAAGKDPFKRRNNAMRESVPASAFAHATAAAATPPASEPPSQQATPKAAASARHVEIKAQPVVELQAPASRSIATAAATDESEVRRSAEQEQAQAPVARLYPGVPAATASAAAARSNTPSSSGAPAFHAAPVFSPSAVRKSPVRGGIDSPWRLDPASRADRVLTTELKELRASLAAQAREVERLSKAMHSARDDAEGWKAECESHEASAAEAARATRDVESALAREQRKRQELEVRFLELRCELDEREWARLTGADKGGMEQVRDTNIELVVARNEVTYQTHRGHELARTLDEAKAQARRATRRAETAEARVEVLEEETNAVRQRLADEKERPKQIARQALSVEEERNAALEQVESLREQLDARAAGGSDAKAAAAALKRAEARVAREEEKRAALEAQVADLKKRLKEAASAAAAAASSSSPSKAKSKAAPAPASRKRHATPPSSDEEADEPAPLPARKVAKLAPAPAAAPKAKALPASSKTFSLSGRKALEPMQGASDAVAPTSDLAYDDEDGGGTPSPPPAKRPAAKAAKPSTARYAPVYRDDSASESDVSREEEDYVAPAAQAHVRKTSNPRKRKSVENDEKRRLALEAEVMATPMVRKPASRPVAAAKEAEGAAAGIKKKRRLLGGAQGAQTQGFFKWSGGDTEVLHPNLDLPMELSPVKPSNPHAMRPPQAGSSRAFR